jgi:hypothetical protein
MLAKTVGTGVGRAVSDTVAKPSLTILCCFGFAAAVAMAFLTVAITAAYPEYPNDQAVLCGLSESTSISTSRTADGRERGRPSHRSRSRVCRQRSPGDDHEERAAVGRRREAG